MREYIMYAAIIRPDHRIVFGKSHAECMEQKPLIKITQEMQGFLTSQWRFVSRAEASRIAWRAGQIQANQAWVNTNLLSDQLWDSKKGGICSYHPDRGYQWEGSLNREELSHATNLSNL
jgi:hypothetical protein